MNSSFLSEEELSAVGFKSLGSNVLISRKASIYSAGSISIGNHVRIDDFCILSGEITLGSYIHISAYTAMYGRFGIFIADFATISGRVLIYSQNDDYSGNYMTNPMVPTQYTKVSGGTVNILKHAIIGSGSVLLPDIIIGEGACVGSMSLVKHNVPEWEIVAGVPARKIGDRKKGLIDLESRFLSDIKNHL